ncbi:MAG: hypothetical protein WC069_05970 [Candidatus Shapirobacteria bacterium]
MNTKIMEKMSDNQEVRQISEALQKLKEMPQQKEGVDLVDIAKKLSEKKFGRK